MSTGMTWDEVQDQLDLPSLNALTRYWTRHPPVHLMVAAYLGIKAEPEKAEPVQQADLSAFLATIPQVKR
jgi:hypothetical protein